MIGKRSRVFISKNALTLIIWPKLMGIDDVIIAFSLDYPVSWLGESPFRYGVAPSTKQKPSKVKLQDHEICKRAITSKRYGQQILINKSLEFSHSKTSRERPFLVAVFSCIFSSSFFLKFLMLIFHLNIFMLGTDSVAKCRFLIIIRKFCSSTVQWRTHCQHNFSSLLLAAL